MTEKKDPISDAKNVVQNAERINAYGNPSAKNAKERSIFSLFNLPGFKKAIVALTFIGSTIGAYHGAEAIKDYNQKAFQETREHNMSSEEDYNIHAFLDQIKQMCETGGGTDGAYAYFGRVYKSGGPQPEHGVFTHRVLGVTANNAEMRKIGLPEHHESGENHKQVSPFDNTTYVKLPAAENYNDPKLQEFLSQVIKHYVESVAKDYDTHPKAEDGIYIAPR